MKGKRPSIGHLDSECKRQRSSAVGIDQCERRLGYCLRRHLHEEVAPSWHDPHRKDGAPASRPRLYDPSRRSWTGPPDSSMTIWAERSISERAVRDQPLANVKKWPGPNLRCLHRDLQFEIHVLAASGSLLASPRTHGPGVRRAKAAGCRRPRGQTPQVAEGPTLAACGGDRPLSGTTFDRLKWPGP